MKLTPFLAYALQACRVTQNGDRFCYSWIPDSFKPTVKPSHLKQLEKQGLLQRVDGSRGGHRAYYFLNPDSPQ